MSVSRQRTSSFGAPWGRSVKVITGGVVALMLTLAVVMPLVIPRDDKDWWAAFIGPGVFALILAGASLFCVRGFAIRRGDLWVRRLFWETCIPLDELSGAWADPEAMRRSFRTWGNGGLTAYTGGFRNKKLGSYRAFVTDPKRAVVLEIGEKKIVVSPDRPSAFLRALGLDPKA